MNKADHSFQISYPKPAKIKPVTDKPLTLITLLALCISLKRKVPYGKCPDSKAYGANMGSTWVLSPQMGPTLAPWNLAIRVLPCVDVIITCSVGSVGLTGVKLRLPFPMGTFYLISAVYAEYQPRKYYVYYVYL